VHTLHFHGFHVKALRQTSLNKMTGKQVTSNV
jgi:hypothetical protein